MEILEAAIRECETLEDCGEYLTSRGVLHFGIEGVSEECGHFRYINMGDTYDLTIVENKGLHVMSWGDCLEEMESEYCEDEGVTRCGYCGKFTPLDPDTEWPDAVCECCEHKIGGD